MNEIVLFQLHAEEIKKNKDQLEHQKIEERNALNDKLKTAAILRDENIKRILERLREHVSYQILRWGFEPVAKTIHYFTFSQIFKNQFLFNFSFNF